MKPMEIQPGIWSVGVVDWNCRDFHGYLESPLGTTYNAFLITKGDKTILVDTVKEDFKHELGCNIAHVLGKDAKIDYVICNHLEPDHSGSIEYVMERYKPEKIFLSKMGMTSMKGLHHKAEDWPLEVPDMGEDLDLGGVAVRFVEERMLHWPDNMGTYLPAEKILFSSDAFGQNWATTERFCDQVDQGILYYQLGEYFANIVQPYSPMVQKVAKALRTMDIEMLAPDHGMIFRGKCVPKVLDDYERFASQRPYKRAVVVYETMWHSTEKLAHAVVSGLVDGGVDARLYHMKATHHSRVMTELLFSGGVACGSPTHNNNIMPLMADMLTYMKGLRPKNKVSAAFGSFGWSGECCSIISEYLDQMEMSQLEDHVRTQYAPGHEGLKGAADLGRDMAKQIITNVDNWEQENG